MIPSGFSSKQSSWVHTSPWRLFVFGIAIALAVVIISVTMLFNPPISEMAVLVGTLSATSIFSLFVGYLLYRHGWASSPSLSVTLVVTNAWAALLTFFNVWVMARLMFVNAHDLALASILLVFAAIIAFTFGIFVAANMTDGLRQLARAANALAEGDLAARAEIAGRDEVALVASSFNNMAEQLEQATAQREEVERLRRDLIAWTSHDLRTPLTSIRVMIEALNDGLITDEETIGRYYRTLQAEVIAMKKLIDDLFELAQFDADGVKLSLGHYSLRDLISDALESFRPIAEQKNVTLDFEVTGDLDSVEMDATRISRVLNNLLNNSLQYTPRTGRVMLRAAGSAEEVMVRIIDTGPGFSEGDLPRVFERFFRGENARSRAYGGAGLGLAISSGIVEAHGGRIWARNSDGGGAEVGFAIPAG